MDNKIPLLLHYTKESPSENENSPSAHNRCNGVSDIGWEQWSLPIGNGHFGANVFGRCECERIQITEKTLQNPPTLVKDNVTYFVGGLNSFSETYIDFGHNNVTEYRRYLDLETAIAGVEYRCNGTKYTREYFASYPHKILVIKLDSDKNGELSFTLRPTIPYKQSYGGYNGDGVSKTGMVTSYVENGIGTVELSGKFDYYGIDFLGIYRIYTNGGRTEAINVENTYTDKDGTKITDINGAIRVTGATSAYIIVSLGTDYELSSDVFTSSEDSKPTMFTSLDSVRTKIYACLSKLGEEIGEMNFNKAYEYLKSAHITDHSEFFGRVSLDFGDYESDASLTTDELLKNYSLGHRSNYLEALMFQYGRYLLIASSRKGALPANLQGAWNTYNVPPWACGYWHNINVQMNYWPAFSTNLAETFEAYVDYNSAYMKEAKKNANEVVAKYNPTAFGKDGGNGWVIGTDGYQFRITPDRSAGNLGFTTQLFREYYAYTKDKGILNHVYELLIDAARYITKCVEQDENGYYLVSDCDSPEMHVNGIWYRTSGTAYAQMFAYNNNYNLLLTAKELGIDLNNEELLKIPEYSVLKTVLEQIDRYDPVQIGLSGQIKEFREEDYYCSIGDEYHHRHISHIVGLYPGDVINSTTPAWLDAAVVSLNERGDNATGWGLAHRFNAHARTKNGDRAHKVLEAIISKRTAPNLWNLHPPFQIDGNFGLTAGISEMLVQSHEGYIAPLAALPSDWKCGSFSGLIARGNFEVSASWEDSLLKTLKINSRSGGKLSLCYPSITKTCITNEIGNNVAYTVLENDVITFDTKVGAVYTVSGFIRTVKPASPSELTYAKEDAKKIKLTWNTVDNVCHYNVYKADESASDYTLIGTASENEFIYIQQSAEDDIRTTFAVTSVSFDGVESDRTLCYKNPRVITEYGVIPAENADAPFAIFRSTAGKYAYVGSFESYGDAIEHLSDTSGEHTVIYVTRNSRVSSLSKTEIRTGDILIDLAGRTLTLADNLIEIESTSAENLKIEAKNGKILTDRGSVLQIFSSKSSSDITNRNICVHFNNIIFGRHNESGKTVSLFRTDKNSDSIGSLINLTLSNCNIDYITTSENAPVTLFDFESSNVKTEIKGGIIKLKTFRTVTLFNEKKDSFIFTKNEAGERAAVKLIDQEEPEMIFMTDDGEKTLKFVKREKIHFTIYTDYTLSD